MQPDSENSVQQILYDGDTNTYSIKSVICLPEAEPLPWSKFHTNTPVGSLQKHSIKSDVLNEYRDIWIYKPALEHEPAEYGLCVQLDGQYHLLPTMSVPVILDNLITAKKIMPMITIFGLKCHWDQTKL